MPDATFKEPRLAGIHDLLEPERCRPETYLAISHEFHARRVLDIGCGNGTFACLVTNDGIDVIGVVPQPPRSMSLDTSALRRVRWVLGDATTASNTRSISR